MKKKIIESDETISIVNAYEEYDMPTFEGPIVHRKIQKVSTELFTDASSYDVIEEEEHSINGCYSINDKLYQKSVTTETVKKIKLNNYTFAVVFILAKESYDNGFYYELKDIEIHLKNINDKEALKEAKKTIRAINSMSNITYEFLPKFGLTINEKNQTKDNVHILTKIRKK